MTSRKNIWDKLDELDGKKKGSSFSNLQKERARQGYKPENTTKQQAKHNALLKKKDLANKIFKHSPSEGYDTPHHKEYMDMSHKERDEINTYMGRLHRRKNK